MAKIPINSEKIKKVRPYKKGIFDTFILWLTMPTILRQSGMNSERIKNLGFDPNDPIINKLLSIGTRTQFAKEFHINVDTLSSWEHLEEIQEILDKAKQAMVLKYEKDVDFHFTQMVIKESDAARVKLWKQLYRGWTDTRKLEMSGEVDIGISELAKSLQKIYEIATENNNSEASDKGDSQ